MEKVVETEEVKDNEEYVFIPDQDFDDIPIVNTLIKKKKKKKKKSKKKKEIQEPDNANLYTRNINGVTNNKIENEEDVKKQMAIRNVQKKIALDVIRNAVNDDGYAEAMLRGKNKEDKYIDYESNQKIWANICSKVYDSYKNDPKLGAFLDQHSQNILNKTVDPVTFYSRLLLDHFTDLITLNIIDMIDKDVFVEFQPSKTPLVMCAIQTRQRMFPKIDMIISLKSVVDHGLAPLDAMKKNEYGDLPIAYALFNSISIHFNLFGIFYHDKIGLTYEWIVFDRRHSNMTEVMNTKQDPASLIKIE